MCRLWEGISTSLYPPSKHAQDPLVYHNDAKALVLDRNHRYRVLCFGFDVADVERADRRFSPVYQIEDYSFQVGPSCWPCLHPAGEARLTGHT